MEYRLVFFFLFCSTILLGQDQPTGLLFDESAYNNNPVISSFGDGSKSNDFGIDTSKIDLTPYCPKVMYQRGGTCVGWAVGYAALSIEQAVQNDWKNKRQITENAFSAHFIYNQIKIDDCDGGTFIDKALSFLQDNGDISSQEFDTSPDCNIQPTDKQQTNALQNKIQNWDVLFRTYDPTHIKNQRMKFMLSQKKPVVVCMAIKNNFKEIRSPNGVWYPERKVNKNDLKSYGNHAMVVVGFDDYFQGGAFKLMNSWGKSWGDKKGFCWIRYEDFPKYCLGAFSINSFLKKGALDDLENLVQLQGTAYFNHPARVTLDSNIIWRPIDLTFDGKKYTANKEWKRKSKFQLNLENISDRTYLYVLSQGADKKVNVHWPRDNQFDNTYDGLPESALITNSNVQLTIPPSDNPKNPRVIKFNYSGNETVCMLFSKIPIKNLNEVIGELEDSTTASFYKRLESIFGNRLLENERMKLGKGKMQFKTVCAPDAIVSVILEIGVR